tara:strand:+ start:484 stop:807 length:324 start_codon:yes stop_codon:yes gene_type:complete
MNNIKIVRLSTGEELVCKLLEDSEDSVILKDPAILIPAGRDQLAFGQWMPYAKYENGVEINKRFIIFTVECQDDLKNQYNSTFGNGLVVPQTGGIRGSGVPDLKLTT